MKFSEKYPKCRVGEVIRGNDLLLVSKEEKPCFVCGEMTKFIDCCFEDRVCSDECEKKATEDWYESFSSRKAVGV